MKKRLFWQLTALLFGVLALLCFPWAPVRFGTFFFGVLAVGCAGEYYAVRHLDSVFWRRIALLGRILFCLFLLSLLLIEGMILSGGQADPAAEKADYVLVLGARIYEDRPSLTLAYRLDTAREYLARNPQTILVLCGGQGGNEPMPEAHMMRDYLLTRGVSESSLLIEDKSRNTIQNIRNAAGEFIPPTAKTAVITSDFHLLRAKNLMRQAGLDPVGIPAPTPYLAQRVILHLREYGSILGLMLSGRWW